MVRLGGHDHRGIPHCNSTANKSAQHLDQETVVCIQLNHMTAPIMAAGVRQGRDQVKTGLGTSSTHLVCLRFIRNLRRPHCAKDGVRTDNRNRPKASRRTESQTIQENLYLRRSASYLIWGYGRSETGSLGPG